MASGVTSAATLATAFGGDSLSEFVELPKVLVGIVFIAVLSLINFRGIKESVGLNLGLTAIELVGLLLVVVIGAALLLDGGGDPGRALDFKSGSSVPLAVLGGASLAFFALIGFEDSVNVAEETKEPSRVYPRALFLGLGIAGTVYMLVTVVASMAVETSKLIKSDGPLLEVVDQGPLGVPTKLFAAIALFALTNGALINLIMASRIVYGMSNEGIVPAAFGRVHEGRQTPWVAIAFTAGLALVLVTLGDLESLADTTVLLLLIVFVCVNVAVLVLRSDRVEHEHFRAPGVIALLGAAACAALIVQKAVAETDTFLYAGGLIALGDRALGDQPRGYISSVASKLISVARGSDLLASEFGDRGGVARSDAADNASTARRRDDQAGAESSAADRDVLDGVPGQPQRVPHPYEQEPLVGHDQDAVVSGGDCGRHVEDALAGLGEGRDAVE